MLSIWTTFCIFTTMIKKSELIFFKDYFRDFYKSLTKKVQTKIIWTFKIIEDLDRIPEIFLNILKIQMDYTRYEFKWVAIFIGFFAFSMTKILWL
jgi:hypothetical protein